MSIKDSTFENYSTIARFETSSRITRSNIDYDVLAGYNKLKKFKTTEGLKSCNLMIPSIIMISYYKTTYAKH